MRFPPINPKCPHFLHGGDYNPDQWPPEVWEEDMRLMKLAHCNAQSVGIFSWAQIEPAEGHYTFGWLDRVMDLLAQNGAYAVLATPSAAPPAWMSRRYPEILRVGPDRVRRLHGNRVNTCWSSPVYRDHCRTMARTLAERYRDHPALLVWHVFNEYSGECHCDLCQGAFRNWLQAKFGTLDALNAAYWTAFWGHTYTAWEQIQSPGGPYGKNAIHGLTLDWKRFTTQQVVDRYRNEADVLRPLTPCVPVTTNLMGTFAGLDYWKLIPHVDVVSWDAYPQYHDRPNDWDQACGVSFTHDLYRTFKGGRPFMLMESTPSTANWWPVMKLKRPGIHRLTSLQAVAHGADTVQYFQWRQSRGGAEKFHGAVVAHDGSEKTRVFGEVAEVGALLKKLDPVIGTSVQAEVAVVYDWENLWAIETAAGPRRQGRDYVATCQRHYRPFWRRGVPVDVVNADADFSAYRLVVAPMLYMVRPGVAERLEAFVRAGGTFVTTYWSGIADENDLCFLGGFPGPLRPLLGIWSEELDVLHDDEHNRLRAVPGNALGLDGEWEARLFCDLVHPEGAQVLATYQEDFYAGRAALTANAFGAGTAYYLAARTGDDLHDALYGRLCERLGLRRVLDADLPRGVTAQMRTDGEQDFLFLLNFTGEEARIALSETGLTDLVSGQPVGAELVLPGYGSAVLRRPAG